MKGKLNDKRFETMSQNYEAEQKQLEAEVAALRQEIEVQERQNENIERFIRRQTNTWTLRKLIYVCCES
ncbi:MAG: hypothetical protein IJA55_07915 [Clostridia bacterium]|nr:hypothetical protein [Clostridia bacterium]